MKKLMIMIAALATGFLGWAEDVPSPIKDQVDLTAWATDAKWLWNGAARGEGVDPTAAEADVVDSVLQFKTGSNKLERQYNGATGFKVEDAIFIDASINLKDPCTEILAAGDEDTKLAVFLLDSSEMVVDQGASSALIGTNICVIGGFDNNGTWEKRAFLFNTADYLSKFAGKQEIRLTLKVYENVMAPGGGYRKGFRLFIDGADDAQIAKDAIRVNYVFNLKDDNTIDFVNGIIQPQMEGQENYLGLAQTDVKADYRQRYSDRTLVLSQVEGTANLTGIEFMGTGALSALKLTTEAPRFIEDDSMTITVTPENVASISVSGAGNPNYANGVITFYDNQPITVTAIPETGYQIGTWTYNGGEVTDVSADVKTIVPVKGKTLTISYAKKVAEVNGVAYDSFDDALEALNGAAAGSTLKLFDDVTLSETYATIENMDGVVLDLAGKTIMGEDTTTIYNTGVLTITNSVGAGHVAAVDDGEVSIINVASLTIEAGIIDGSILNGFSGGTDAAPGTLVITGGQFDGAITTTIEGSSVVTTGGDFAKSVFETEDDVPGVEGDYEVVSKDDYYWTVVLGEAKPTLTVPTLDYATAAVTTNDVPAGADGEYVVEIGDSAKVIYTADEGYLFETESEPTNVVTLTYEDIQEDIDVDVEAPVPAQAKQIVVPSQDQSKAFTNYYLTAQAAMASIYAEAIILLADGEITAAPANDRTIDLNGFDLTFASGLSFPKGMVIIDSKESGSVALSGANTLEAKFDMGELTASQIDIEDATFSLGANGKLVLPDRVWTSAEDFASIVTATAEGASVVAGQKSWVWIDNAWNAPELSGSGTEDDPYILANRADFLFFRDGCEKGTYGLEGQFFKVKDGVTAIDLGTAPYQVYSEFKSTFDGNNAKITFKVGCYQGAGSSGGNYPYYGFFFQANGATIKNATFNGSLTMGAGNCYCAIIVSHATGDIDFENVTCEGSVTHQYNGAAFVCKSGECTIDFVNCTNKADLIATGAASKHAAFVNYGSASTSFRNCRNEGDISITSSSGTCLAGGFLAYPNRGADVTHYFEDCENAGNIVCNAGADAAPIGAGGFIADNHSSKGKATITFVRCVNSGNVTVTSTKDGGSSKIGAAGFLGNSANGATCTNEVTFTDCAQTGTITLDANGGKAVPYSFIAVADSAASSTYMATGTNTAKADVLASAVKCDGLAFATVSGDVATFGAAANNSKVMTEFAEYAFATGDASITFDETLAVAKSVTTVEHATVTKSESTYTSAWDEFEIAYVDEDGSDLGLTATKWTAGSTLPIALKTPAAKTGFTFDGWTNAVYTTAVKELTALPAEFANMTLAAQWTAEQTDPVPVPQDDADVPDAIKDIFGQDNPIADVVTDRTKLEAFNAFLTAANVTKAADMTTDQKANIRDSYFLAAITGNALLEAPAEIKIESIAATATPGTYAFEVSIKSDDKSVIAQACVDAIAGMVQVATELGSFGPVDVKNIATIAYAEGNVTFTVSYGNGAKGFLKIEAKK